MDKDNILMPMVHFTKEFSKMTKSGKVKEQKSMQTATLIQDSSKIYNLMDKERELIQMVHPSKEYSKTIKSGKVMEQKSMMMEIRIQVNLKMESFMEKENYLLPTELSRMVTLKTTSLSDQIYE